MTYQYSVYFADTQINPNACTDPLDGPYELLSPTPLTVGKWYYDTALTSQVCLFVDTYSGGTLTSYDLNSAEFNDCATCVADNP